MMLVLLMDVPCKSSAFHAPHLFLSVPDLRLNYRLSRFLIAEAVNASHRPSATDNALEAYQLRS